MVKDVFKFAVLEDGEVAEVLLYGFIGEDFWAEPGKTQITDEIFAVKMRELEKNHPRINLRINSPGGSMMHGNAIINAIKASKSEVHAYNDGLCASMAADIFMSCKNRHMAKNALLMVHAPMSICMGNAAAMRDCANTLDVFESGILHVMSEATGMDEKQIKKEFYDGKDHWLDYKKCLSLGIAQADGEEYEAVTPPADLTTKSYQEVVAYFQEKNNAGQKRPGNWLHELTTKFWEPFKKTAATEPPASPDNGTSTHIQNLEPEMITVENIKTAIEKGELKAEDLAALLPEKVAAPAASDTPAPTEAKTDTTALEAKVDALAALVEKMAKAPGAAITHGQFPENVGDDDDNFLKAYNQKLWDSRNEVVRFTEN